MERGAAAAHIYPSDSGGLRTTAPASALPSEPAIVEDTIAQESSGSTIQGQDQVGDTATRAPKVDAAQKDGLNRVSEPQSKAVRFPDSQ